MDKFQGIFDQGFSGILQESSSKTMPDYIEKLAESEIDYEPPVLEVPNILFDKDPGLSRANELTSDGSRESSRENRFTAERTERESFANLMRSIDKEVNRQIEAKTGYVDIRSALYKKHPKEVVVKYLQSKIKLILDKYSYLGFENINEKHANIVDQSSKEFQVRRSTVHDILDKFSKLEFITTAKSYKHLLLEHRPIDVAAAFLFSLDQIKQAYYEGQEARVAFQRDIDDKQLSLRDIDNNKRRNEAEKRQEVYAAILSDWKAGINAGLSQSEIGKKIAGKWGFNTFKKFVEGHKEEIRRIEKFARRQTFNSDFANSALQGVEIEPKAKQTSIDVKAMTNHAFDLLTRGEKLETVESSLKRVFGLDIANQYIAEHGLKLQRHYGQLGYLFIDSNIYASCDEMAKTYSTLQHVGNKLIYSLKSNSKCSGCSLNKEGSCSKVGLLISNNPIARSSRATKRVLKKATEFVPKTYIDIFASKIDDKGSNLKLVSKFALGIEGALNDEKKNIGKQASKDRTITMETQESFITPLCTDFDFFDKASDSEIIDQVLNKTKISFKEEDLKKAIAELSFVKKKLRKRFLALSDDALTIRAAKQLGKEYHVRFQDILKTVSPSRNLKGEKYWDASGEVKG
jgi:hypothetical protein